MKQAERGLRFPASVLQQPCEDMLSGDPLECVQHAIRALCQLLDSAPQPILSAPWRAMNDGDLTRLMHLCVGLRQKPIAH